MTSPYCDFPLGEFIFTAVCSFLMGWFFHWVLPYLIGGKK